MSGFCKQSAAAYVDLGPFVAATDGKTRLTALSLLQSDILVSKLGGTMTAKSHVSACSHLSAGVYRCPLAAADVNTPGRLRIEAVKSSALPVWETITVLPPHVYDSLIGGTDTLQADVTQVKGSAISASNAQFGANVVNWKGAAAVDLTGDAYARLGPPAGASVSADLAVLDGIVDSILAKASAIAAKLPSKAYLTGTANSDGDVQASEMTGNFPGSVASVTDKTGYALTAAYDPAKTAAQSSALSAVAAKVTSIQADTSAIAAVDFGALTSAVAAIDTGAITAMTDSLSAVSVKIDQILSDTSAIAAVDFSSLTSAVAAIDTGAITALSDDMAAVTSRVSALPDTAAIRAALETAGGYLERLHRRFYGKAAMTATEIKVFADDGVTPISTQTLSDDGTTQIQGAAG